MRNTSSEVKVLQVTCSHCGHVRIFAREEHLTVMHLEAITDSQCIDCGAQGAVFGFVSYPLRPDVVLEKLPAPVHSGTHARM